MARKIQTDIPSDIAKDAGLGKENIGPEDVYWTGDTGDLDVHELLREHGHDPEGPLEMLLRAIIAKHPDPRRSAEDRLSLALEALTRQTATGRRQNDDYDLLLDIAWKYHERAFLRVENIELAPIIRDCLKARTGNSVTRSEDGENSEVKRLKRKFEKNKDLLLARVTADMDLDRMDVMRQVHHIATELQKLGVGLDPSVIRPRRRGQNTP